MAQQRRNRQWSNNSFTLVGNLAADPVTKATQSGPLGTRMAIYVHEEDKDGNRKDVVFNGVFRGKNSANFPGGAKEGSFVRIEGTLKSTYVKGVEGKIEQLTLANLKKLLPNWDTEILPKLKEMDNGKGTSQIFLNPISCQVLAVKKDGEATEATEETFDDPASAF